MSTSNPTQGVPIFEPIGSVQGIDHTKEKTLNLKTILSIDKVPSPVHLDMNPKSVFNHALFSSATTNFIAALNASQDSLGNYRLMVDASGMTLTTGNQLAAPSSSQTVVGKQFVKVGTGVETLYTPTANKTFYLVGLSITEQSGSATQVDILQRDGSSVLATVYLNNATQVIPGGGYPMQTYDSTHALKANNGSAASKITFWGFEQ